MPGLRRLALVLNGLLLASGANQALAAPPTWECRTGTDGGWNCSKDGVAVPAPEAPAAPARADESAAVVTPLAEPAAPAPQPLAPDSSNAQTIAAPKPAPAQTAAEEMPPTETVEPAASEPSPEPAVTEAPAAPVESEPEPPPPAAVAAPEPVPEPAPAPRPEPEPEVESREFLAVPQAEPTPQAPPEQSLEETPDPVAEPPAELADEAPVQPAADITPATDYSEPMASAGAPRALSTDWDYCGAPPRGTALPRHEPADADTLTHVQADDAILRQNAGTATFAGDVILDYGDQTLRADQVDYDRNTGRADANGHLYFTRPDFELTGESGHVLLGEDKGEVSGANYRMKGVNARGSAERMDWAGEVSHYDDMEYTTCRPGNSDWLLQAETLELDQGTGVGTATHAKLFFKGVPLAYLPVATFPIDDRRKSGFLPPKIGHTTTTGADISIPYYFNLAPNYDATFSPRIMSERGLLLGGEFRFLTENSEGTLRAEILPDDSKYDGNEPRGAFFLDSKIRLAPRWRSDLYINHVSDGEYFEDLGSSLAVTSTQYLERRGDLRYSGNYWNALARVQHYQTLDDTILPEDRPYSRLPQVLATGEMPVVDGNLLTHFRAEYVHFVHDQEVDGDRIDLMPALSYDWRRAWGYLTPKATLRHTRYELDDQVAGLPSTPDRNTQTFSLDGGLFFERPSQWLEQATTLTLEPRLFYLYTPYKDQDDLPVFDTGQRTFGFDALFRENRFSGADRVGDANQITFAVTSRMLAEETGEEWFSASLGQILYFRDRRVQLPNTIAVQDDSSALVSEVTARLSQHWRTQAALQWNPNRSSNQTERSGIRFGYSDEEKRLFNAAYRYNRDLSEHTDLSAYWPLSHNTRLIARWNYSLRDSRTLEALGGVEYGSCCWRVRAVVRDYQVDDSANSNLSFMVQLELTGLGRFGDDIGSYLERGIYGYIEED